MKNQASLFLLLALFALAVPSSEAGQELSLLAGSATFNDTNDTSLAWQVEYRNDFHRNLALSATYLNEGHVIGRKRDGLAVQGWGITQPLKEKLSLGLGLGLYRYYNTNSAIIERGWAPTVAVSATYYLKPPWFVRANWFRIEHPHNGDSDLFFAGAGYRF